MGFLTPNAAGEHAVLRTYALQQLAQMRTTAHGLTDEQARTAPTASSLTLSALLLHTAAVAVYWSASAAAAPEPPTLPGDIVEDPTIESLLADERDLDEVLATFDRCVELTAEAIDAVTDLGVLVPVPEAPWYPDDLTHWEARWCLAHLCAEVARHVGHADIIRETLDGRTSFGLNDDADATG